MATGVGVQQFMQAVHQQAQRPIPETVYITFNAEITPASAEGLLAVMANCATQGVKKVYLAMSSPGGDVMQGMTLYNVLRGMPFELTTHNVGNIDSMGNVVFLAGVKRYACAHATFMFHGVGFDMRNQNVRLEEKNVLELLDNITNNHRRIGTILEERTKIDKALIPELFREAQTKDANFAVSSGIIDEIRDLQIPPGGPVISLVFQR
jgi:ATP-dependent protease ClpP protease subunit